MCNNTATTTATTPIQEPIYLLLMDGYIYEEVGPDLSGLGNVLNNIDDFAEDALNVMAITNNQDLKACLNRLLYYDKFAFISKEQFYLILSKL